MRKDSRIFVAGHRGLVGSAILETLQERGYDNLLTRTKKELNLLDMRAVEDFFATMQPEYVFLCAAKVGGIIANNTYRADFIYENLMIQNHIIHCAYRYQVKKLLFLGSSCIYPKSAPQPLSEDSLLTSPLEYTNEPYAIAKIAGIKMCESYNLQYQTNFIAVMPTNLYGKNDNFDLQNSHVLPALIRKFHEAKLRGDKEVSIWGSGKPRREFLYNKDLAEACVYVMEKIDFSMLTQGKKEVRNTHLNIGYGSDISIAQLAELVREIVGFEGGIVFDTSKPDGTYQKLMDSSKIFALGWKPKVGLREGIEKTYQWYLS
ncbi:GDP-L-fucose synthase family protein [Helicobacter mustelae]|uniref:GDP-L-fucose synthase n=1 Tax=Helicobacter mustelae (strain ATCC 43772 / CCUG 25715 / CIP 103759 / LMG 18044 / NCTC 12198 / R85-136P) TaxID=679897 RepID=D3UFT3_HELM1|nr:GDP-L-fucose synthase [Helicobacter mustelae]CBG39354.1 putative GDP-L-fucose synthetase [Helicobacter mustelae 12198]SQH70863.1 GDP-L-fucose synthetase [Helicobacter mustelae]STP11991.1 GDP-L-fucose synthetase [Helicobacter mustelae]